MILGFKNLKRVLSLALCLTITAGCFSGMTLPAEAQEEIHNEEVYHTLSGNNVMKSTLSVEETEEDEECIYDGDTKTVTIINGQTVYLKFVPEENGIFTFSSSGSSDTKGYVRDSARELMEEDDDDGEIYNFSITREFEKGVTYYLGANFCGANRATNGEITIRLILEDELCSHENVKRIQGKEATCYEDGYAEGVQCQDCKSWLPEQELIKASHADENEDGVCERCNKTMPIKTGNCGSGYENGGYSDAVRYYQYANGELEIFGNGEIHDDAFSHCDSIEKVIIHEGVSKIGDDAFYSCYSLEEIILPDSTTQIGDLAFYDCYSLEEIILPDSITQIGDYAFYSCYSLEEIILPDSTTQIGDYAFSADTVIWCTKGSCAENYAVQKKQPYVLIDGGDEVNIITGKFGTRFTWTLDKRTGLFELRGSGKIPSLNNTDAPWQEYIPYITKLSLPSGITEIGSGFISDLYKLKDIYAPSIEEWVKISFSDEPMCYAKNLYLGNELVKDVKIPEGTTEIYPYAFAYCNSIESVEIPASVRSIDSMAFYGCSALTEVIFEADENNWSSLSSIGGRVFAGCPIKEITIPASVSYINGSAFSSELEKITIYNPECSVTGGGITYRTEICGFSGSTAEKLANDLSAAFVDIEEVHEHQYKGVGSLGFCKRERCICGKELTKAHTDKNADGICEVCKQSTDDLSITETKTTHLRHNETLQLSYTVKEEGVYTFTVSGPSDNFRVRLLNEKMESINTSWSNDNQAIVSETLEAGKKVYLSIVNQDYDGYAQIAVDFHKHQYTPEVIKEGSCTEGKEIEYRCSCGKWYREYEYSAHPSSKISDIKQATLYLNGRITRVCTKCGEILSSEKIYTPSVIEFVDTHYIYTGKKITPTVTVRDSEGRYLINGTDYDVSYASSSRKNIGKYTATVTFKGNYSGSKKITFYIVPAKTSELTYTRGTGSLNVKWKTVTGASGYKVELLSSTGKTVKTVHTKNKNYKFTGLSSGTTYTVKVCAYATVGGAKQYSPAEAMILATTTPAKTTLKATAGTKKVSLSWKKVTGSGYQIVYSTNSKFSSKKTVTVTSGSTVKKTIKNLTKGKTYYFKVRAYKTVANEKIYGNYSSVVKVKVK